MEDSVTGPGVGDPASVIRGRRGILVVLLVYCLAGDAVAVVALVFSLKSNLGEDLFLLVVCSLGILLFVPFVIKPPVLLRFGPLGLQEFRGWLRRPRDLVPWSSVRAIRLFTCRPWRVGMRDRRLGIVPAIPYDPVWDSRRRSTRAFGLPITIGERDVVIEDLISPPTRCAPSNPARRSSRPNRQREDFADPSKGDRQRHPPPARLHGPGRRILGMCHGTRPTTSRRSWPSPTPPSTR